MPFQNGFALNNEHSVLQEKNTQALPFWNLDGGILCIQIKKSGLWPFSQKGDYIALEVAYQSGIKMPNLWRASLVQAVESYRLWSEGLGFESRSPRIAQARVRLATDTLPQTPHRAERELSALGTPFF